MRIALGTVEISDYERILIAKHYGLDGLAPRDLCRSFIIGNGIEELPNLALTDDLANARALDLVADDDGTEWTT